MVAPVLLRITLMLSALANLALLDIISKILWFRTLI